MASTISDDLQRYFRNEAVEAGPPSSIYRALKLVMRRRAPFAVAALVLLALIGSLVATSLALAEATRTWELAETKSVEAVRQQRLADEEAARASAISEFLIEGPLSSVDPSEPDNHEFTMRNRSTTQRPVSRAASADRAGSQDRDARG